MPVGRTPVYVERHYDAHNSAICSYIFAARCYGLRIFWRSALIMLWLRSPRDGTRIYYMRCRARRIDATRNAFARETRRPTRARPTVGLITIRVRLSAFIPRRDFRPWRIAALRYRPFVLLFFLFYIRYVVSVFIRMLKINDHGIIINCNACDQRVWNFIYFFLCFLRKLLSLWWFLLQVKNVRYQVWFLELALKMLLSHRDDAS